MNDEIEMMKYILRLVKGDGYEYYTDKHTVKMYQYLLKQYYTIKRYWEETRE